MDLSGKIALVTGSAVRVGRAIALELARAGCDVMVHYNRHREDAEQTAADIRAMGRRSATAGADLADPRAACAALLAAVDREFARLDVLVNNAAVYLPGAPGEMDDADWRRMLAINATAPTLLARRAGPRMADAGGGAVVNILDILARRPWPKYLAYCQTKAALWSATIGLARELAPAVRVNGVAPGVVLWSEAGQDRDESFRARLIEQVPLGRPGSPGDVAKAVRFLAEAGYVTGQVICVDGGRSIGWRTAESFVTA